MNGALFHGRQVEELESADDRIIYISKEAYSSIDSDTKELLEVMANVRIREECKVMEHGNFLCDF